MTKRTIFTLLSVVLLCLMLSATLFFSSTAENIDLTVYISSTGNSENSGLTEEAPVSTLAEALAVANGEVVSASAKVRFVLLSGISVGNDPYGKTPFPYQLTVAGKSGTETLEVTKSYIHHVGNTTYENLHFVHNGAKYSFLCGNGYDLVLGKGLTCTPNSNGYYLNLAGGVHEKTETTFTSDSSLTVLSGQWETLYAGSYNDDQVGNATLYAENCTVHTNVGTCFKMSHTGTSSITLKNCNVGVKSTGMLQGGPTNSAGSLSGKLTLTVEDCTIGKFGVGYKCPITSDLSLTLKNSTVKDSYSVTATGESEIHLSATEGKVLDLSPAEEILATTFTGGGTLVLGEKSVLTADQVSGSTVLDFGDTPALHTYVYAPKNTPDDSFSYEGTPKMKILTVGEKKLWTLSSAVTFKVPEKLTFTLYTDFTDGSKVTPDSVYTKDSETFYSFYSLTPNSKYRYNVKGSGYYQITKNLYVSEEKLKSDLLLDCTPPRLANTGFEPTSNVKEFTDEMRENFITSDPSAWPEYSFIFSSPYFTRDSYETGMHQATTQDEMMAYLEKCIAKNKNLYLFSLGKSPANGFDIPIVIFTASDLTEAKTLKEAAEIVCANGKLNFQYQAQVHGNEPAAGEGALAMIGALSSDWGEKYLSDMNICIIPRINTDGSHAYTRAQVSQSRNLNRDYLLPSAEEVPMILQAYNLFNPEIVVDGHEFTINTGASSGAFNDVTLGTGGNESMDGRFEENGAAMMLKAFENLGKNDLTYNYYTGNIDSVDPTTARVYYQMRGSVSLLVETNGISAGQFGLHRRVISQFLCVEAYFNYAKEHKDELRALSAEVKAKLARDGSTYDADRLFALQTATVKSSDSLQKIVYDYGTGLATGTKKSTPSSADDVQRSRPLPTAYVIPKDENAQVISRIADAHGIFWYELEEGSSAYLYGYNGSYDASTKEVTGVSLTEESLVSFPTGAYVFPMNQATALILASMFEPDNDDIYAPSDRSFTLAQQGTVPFENGSFAMYRSQRDLTNGKIEAITAADPPTGISVIHPQSGLFTGSLTGLDPAILYEYRHENESGFTPIPAESTEISGIPFGLVEIRFAANGIIPASKITTLEILPPASAEPTVHLAPESGSDSAFGAENAPVKTLDRALTLLNVLRRYSTKQATLIFTETLNTTEAIQFPAYDYPLYITSKSGAEGISSSESILLGGDTTIDDFTFTHTTANLRYILANGHKLALGEKIKSAAAENYYYMPVGGGYGNTVQSTDMTILGGTWRNIYIGGYNSGVEGDAHLIAKNCTVIAQLQNSYSGRTRGNVTVELENVTVQKSIFCGNTYQSDVKGNVTLTAKNCKIPLLYAGSRNTGNVDGTVKVTLENCTAADLYGISKDENSTVGASHLTLIDTEPTGEVLGWTSITHGAPQLKGDLDSSGEVDLDDAIYLLYHVNFQNKYPINQEVDFNTSGEVDLDDAIYLLYHVNFPMKYPLH